MARALDDIIRELDAGYNPGRQLINERLAALPEQAEAEISGLNATKANAFDDITAGARQRGLGFAGIPLAEQAKYTASSFLPAVARVRQSQNDVRTSLLDSLNNANLDQRKTAMSIYQAELDRDERRAAEERAAAAARAASAGFDYGSLLGGGGGEAGAPVGTAAGKKGQPSLETFLKQQLSAQPKAPRALQDQWVRQWARLTGKNEGDKAIWAAYNQILPWEQYNDNAGGGGSWRPSGIPVASAIKSAVSNATGNPLIKALSRVF